MTGSEVPVAGTICRRATAFRPRGRRKICSLADTNVVPWRASAARELPRPDCRSSLVQAGTRLLDFRDRIRRGRFDPVDWPESNAACGHSLGIGSSSICRPWERAPCPIISVLPKSSRSGREGRPFSRDRCDRHERTAASCWRFRLGIRAFCGRRTASAIFPGSP